MRIAAIRFINSLPLIYGLEKDRSNEIVYDTPLRCYRRLVDGEVDVALIPVFGTQTAPSIRAVKGLGIAAVNKTESVYVFATKPLSQVRTVACDPASLTSTVLFQIILQSRYNNHSCLFGKSEGDTIHDILRNVDAALVIGDQAILTEKTDYDHYDLATEWYSLTRLPFVFAVWACSRALSDTEKEMLKQSYLQSIEHRAEICERAATMLPVGSEFLERYYNHNLHYQLTKPDYEGLLRFLTLAAELRVVGKIRKDIWL